MKATISNTKIRVVKHLRKENIMKTEETKKEVIDKVCELIVIIFLIGLIGGAALLFAFKAWSDGHPFFAAAILFGMGLWGGRFYGQDSKTKQ